MVTFVFRVRAIIMTYRFSLLRTKLFLTNFFVLFLHLLSARFSMLLMDLTTAGKGVQLMLKRKPRVVEWNSCIDVPLGRGVLGKASIMTVLSKDRIITKKVPFFPLLISSSRLIAGPLHETSREERHCSCWSIGGSASASRPVQAICRRQHMGKPQALKKIKLPRISS